MRTERSVKLDAEKLLEREPAQRYLRETFGFPEYYGRNLDALHDMLGEMRDIEIDLVNFPSLPESSRYPWLVRMVVLESAKENPGIRVLEDGRALGSLEL